MSFKVDSEENTLDSQTSARNGMDPNGVLPKMENLPKTNTAKTEGKNSFAPQDFMFQPLDGLKTYQVTPMTPRSASTFLTPSYTWILLKTDVGKSQEVTKEILAQKCITYSAKTVPQDSDKLQCALGSLTVWNKEHVLNKDETTKNSNGFIIKGVPSLEINEDPISQPSRDVPYLRDILQLGTEKLTSHCLGGTGSLNWTFQTMRKILFALQLGKRDSVCEEVSSSLKGWWTIVNRNELKRRLPIQVRMDLGIWSPEIQPLDQT